MKQTLKTFAKSIYFDILGVVLVVGIAIYSGYLGTNLAKYVDWGANYPLHPVRTHFRYQRRTLNALYSLDRTY